MLLLLLWLQLLLMLHCLNRKYLNELNIFYSTSSSTQLQAHTHTCVSYTCVLFSAWDFFLFAIFLWAFPHQIVVQTSMHNRISFKQVWMTGDVEVVFVFQVNVIYWEKILVFFSFVKGCNWHKDWSIALLKCILFASFTLIMAYKNMY